MVKKFQGRDLTPEAITPSIADRRRDPQDDLAYVLTECTPGTTLAVIATAALRRLIEAKLIIQDIADLEAENQLLREELSQTPQHIDEDDVYEIVPNLTL